MAVISNTRGNPQATDVAVQTATPMLGGASREDLQTVLSNVDSEIAKLFEDRNIVLADGGTLSYAAGSPSVLTLSATLKLHINSQVAGGSPTVITVTGTSFNFSATGRMLYAIVDRIAGTATVTSDSATLPAVTALNQEVVLIAKRIDSASDRIYLRNGQTLGNGDSAQLGAAGVSPSFSDATFNIFDNGDATKILKFEVSAVTTATTRTLSAPDASGTLALTSNNLGAFAATTSAQLAGVISDETGSGSLVFATAPTLVNSALISAATGGATLTGSSLASVSDAFALVLSGFGTTGNVTLGTIVIRRDDADTNGAIVFGTTLSGVFATAGIIGSTRKWTIGPAAAGVTHDILGSLSVTGNILPEATGTREIGSSSLRFNAVHTTSGALKIYNGANALSITATPTAARNITLPDATDTLVGLATTDALTNKTLTSTTNVYRAATPTVIGAVSSYAPVAASSLLITSANYTITDTDGYEVIRVNTNAANVDITLPSAANNFGRRITFIKVSNNNRLRINRAGSDTMSSDGSVTWDLYFVDDAVTFICDTGGVWRPENYYRTHRQLGIAGTSNGAGTLTTDLYVVRTGQAISCYSIWTLTGGGGGAVMSLSNGFIPDWASTNLDLTSTIFNIEPGVAYRVRTNSLENILIDKFDGALLSSNFTAGTFQATLNWQKR